MSYANRNYIDDPYFCINKGEIDMMPDYSNKEFDKKVLLIGNQNSILRFRHGWNYAQIAEFLMKKYNIEELAEYDEYLSEYEAKM